MYEQKQFHLKHTEKQQKALHKIKGFTLIEVMVVVVILGILAAYIVPKIMSRPDEARVVKAQQDVRSLESSLNLYKLDNFTYPTSDQGIQSLESKPSSSPEPKNYKEGGYTKLKKDPWGNPYQYLQPGVHGDMDVFSLGPDQQPSDDDIGNWNIE